MLRFQSHAHPCHVQFLSVRTCFLSGSTSVIPVSPFPWCRCREFCHLHSSTGRRWTGPNGPKVVLMVLSALNVPPEIGFVNSKGKQWSPELMLPYRYNCSQEGWCLRREKQKRTKDNKQWPSCSIWLLSDICFN